VLLHGAEGEHGAFAGDTGGVAKVIAVEDVVADDEDAAAAGAVEEGLNGGGGEVVLVAEADDFFVVKALGALEGSDQGGGGVDDVAAGEDDAAAVADDGVFLGQEAGVAILLVLAAFDVDIWLEQVEQLDGGGVGVHVHRVDAFEGGEALGAKFVGDEGAVDAFVHVRIGADGDHEQVAHGLGELEVVDVSGVDDVEAAVAVDQREALFAGALAEG